VSEIRYILGDTETTDATPDAGVCEIAFVEVDEDLNILWSEHSLIDPQKKITASASGVHGITNLEVCEAPTLQEWFDIILGRRLTGNVVFMGHKVEFDLRHFKPYIEHLAGTLCTLKLAKRFLTDAENHKLQTLMFQYNLHRDKSHSADGDVRTTLSLLRLLKKRSGMDLMSLALLSQQPLFVPKWPFGKHKDKPLWYDMSYVDWAMKNMKELDSDLKWSLEQVKAGRRSE
jgi:DNA polymerase III epsilon subunit-like protein